MISFLSHFSLPIPQAVLCCVHVELFMLTKNMLMIQLILSLRCRNYFSCISAQFCAFLTSLLQLVFVCHWRNSHLRIAKFIAHKINQHSFIYT